MSVGGAMWHAVVRGARWLAFARHALFAAYLRLCVRSPDHPPELPAADAIERLLVIRLDEIGDFVLTTPFLRALRAHYSRARIVLLANASVAGLAATCPYVDELLLFRARRRIPPFEQVGAYLAARRFARARLEGQSFQLAVIPRSDIDNACALAMAYHAGIPIRVGYGEAVYPLRRVKNRNYGRFLTHAVERGEAIHEAACALRIAAFLGANVADPRTELWPRDEERVNARSRLARFRESHRPLVALLPGGALARRQWPAQSFAKLADLLISRCGAQIVLIGGPGEDQIEEQVIGQSLESRSCFLGTTGKLSLGEAAAVLGGCDLFVGNDSGPLHMAAAMGVPCVEISCHPAGGDPFGENSPARFSPWLVPSIVLQPRRALPPCRTGCTKSYAHCIKTIPVEQVFEAASNLLAGRNSGPTELEAIRHGTMPPV